MFDMEGLQEGVRDVFMFELILKMNQMTRNQSKE